MVLFSKEKPEIGFIQKNMFSCSEVVKLGAFFFFFGKTVMFVDAR